MARFNIAKRTVWQWRADYPGIQIKIRQSHRGWMRQYRVEDCKPMPFDSNPDVRLSNLHAEDVHATIPRLLMEMSGARVSRFDGTKTETRKHSRVATLPRLQGVPCIGH